MQDKVLSVFYAEDRLPYKDASRETHYPIVNGNVFNGANNVTKIRYYLDRIGGFANVTWVVVSKLPNGQLASEVLNSNNAVLDSELGENYIEFEISSYYTTLKGDVYLSLQGYQGGVEVEQDEDTGIYSIYGTPTIQATGSIKIGVNYAPQIVPGPHFTTSELQKVLGWISGKANISDVFVVLDDISTSDLSGYNDGQLFYDKATKNYYVKDSENDPDYYIYSFVLNYKDNLQSGDILDTLYTSFGNRYFAFKYQSNFGVCKIGYTTLFNWNVVAYYFTSDGNVNYYNKTGVYHDTTLVSILGGTPNHTFATKEYLDTNFVDLTSQQTISGQKSFSGKTIFSDPNLYNSRITTNSKNYFARVGVTTNQYVNYTLPYNYSQVGNNTLTLAPKYTITLNSAGGTLSGLDLTMVNDDTTVIIYNNETYRKYSVINDLNAIIYRKTTKPSVSSGEITFDEGEITINFNNGFYLASSLLTPITTYTKAKIDTIIENAIAGVKANEFQLVEELPQEGEEGIIYLVEISSGVYQQYIWEGDDYIDLGTTQIDLSGYVPTSRTINNKALTSDITLTSSDIGSVPDTRTIAGLQLNSDITSQALSDALTFMNNTSDLDYVMGE